MTRVLSEVGRPGAVRDVLDGGDVEPTSGRLLSVAELQAALQAARVDAATRDQTPGPAHPSRAAVLPLEQDLPVVGGGSQRRPATVTPPPTQAGDLGPFEASSTALRPPSGVCWVAVVGVHPDAGTSTAALALADALAAAGQPVHLVSCHEPAGCGLLFAPTVELGVDAGGWRTGRRGPQLTIWRPPAPNGRGVRWPAAPAAAGEATARAVTVVDVEPGAARFPRSLAAAAAVVLVCRATGAGLQRAEQLLGPLLDVPSTGSGPAGRVRPVLLIALGAGRWPGAIGSHPGPLVAQLHARKQLIAMPLDRHLSSYGISGRPLPRPVSRAGAVAVRLLTDTTTDTDTAVATRGRRNRAVSHGCPPPLATPAGTTFPEQPAPADLPETEDTAR